MKIAYFGMDIFIDCFRLLIEEGHTIVKLFTFDGDGYDKTSDIISVARKHGIPVQTVRATRQDIAALAEQGVEYTFTAGYPWRIPVTDAFVQLNFHPALLPVGRGPWPMPVAILRGVKSGVTLHKLSEGFDEGDIVMQTEIPLSDEETLITLTDKLHQEAVHMLKDFLQSPESFLDGAIAQGEGEYWPEPTDIDRTLLESDSDALREKKLRAFAGYGCLEFDDGVMWEVDGKKKVPYFRDIALSDKEAVENIRCKYRPMLSDYTFALLYCWRNIFKLSIYIEEDFYAVKGDGYYFFPVGSPERIAAFLNGLRSRKDITLRFADEDMKSLAVRLGGTAVLSEEDCDYQIEIKNFSALRGSEFAKRRNAYNHYAHLALAPQIERITAVNLPAVRALSEELALLGSPDGGAEREAFEHFFELGLNGVLVRRDEEVVAFALYSEKDEKTVQGHFLKFKEKIRGSGIFTMRACTDSLPEQYLYVNMEDDLGEAGLRKFKRSLDSRIIPSYTIRLEKL